MYSFSLYFFSKLLHWNKHYVGNYLFKTKMCTTWSVFSPYTSVSLIGVCSDLQWLLILTQLGLRCTHPLLSKKIMFSRRQAIGHRTRAGNAVGGGGRCQNTCRYLIAQGRCSLQDQLGKHQIPQFLWDHQGRREQAISGSSGVRTSSGELV